MPQKHYTQLKQKERDFIEISLKNHHGVSFIAKELSRDRSTIYREIKRNQKPNKNSVCRVNRTALCKLDGRKYRGTEKSAAIIRAKADFKLRCWYFEKRRAKYIASVAGRKAKIRKSEAGRKANPPRLNLPVYKDTLDFIHKSLIKRWSPEQISLRIRYLNHNLGNTKLKCVAPGTIYHFLHMHSEKQWLKCLRRRGKAYRHEHPQTSFNRTNRSKHSIHDRPKIVNDLLRVGDLEGDTIFGKDKRDRLLTHTDRKSGLTSVSLIKEFNSYKIAKQVKLDVRRVFGKVHTITYDNGVEFTFWKDIEKSTHSVVYFADPYTPGQRGRNENTNGLIRDFLPKGTDFKTLTKDDIMKIEFLINSRPRKRLGGKTPYEAYVALRSGM